MILMVHCPPQPPQCNTHSCTPGLQTNNRTLASSYTWCLCMPSNSSDVNVFSAALQLHRLVAEATNHNSWQQQPASAGPASTHSIAGSRQTSTADTLRSTGSRPSSRLNTQRRLTQLLQPSSLNNVQPGLPSNSYTTQWTTAALSPGTGGATIPTDFLGISHEWTNIEELNHGGSYLQLLKDLTAYGSGPLVLRVGGGSTDLQRDVPPESTWQQLEQLHQATGEKLSAAAGRTVLGPVAWLQKAGASSLGFPTCGVPRARSCAMLTFPGH